MGLWRLWWGHWQDLRALGVPVPDRMALLGLFLESSWRHFQLGLTAEQEAPRGSDAAAAPPVLVPLCRFTLSSDVDRLLRLAERGAGHWHRLAGPGPSVPRPGGYTASASKLSLEMCLLLHLSLIHGSVCIWRISFCFYF